jgi:hypothetical protein
MYITCRDVSLPLCTENSLSDVLVMKFSEYGRDSRPSGEEETAEGAKVNGSLTSASQSCTCAAFAAIG